MLGVGRAQYQTMFYSSCRNNGIASTNTMRQAELLYVNAGAVTDIFAQRDHLDLIILDKLFGETQMLTIFTTLH